MSTGTKPLTASPNKVSAAAFLLPSLKTLVAPGFPDPTDRGDGKPINLQIMIALLIDPKRYPTTIIKIPTTKIIAHLLKNRFKKSLKKSAGIYAKSLRIISRYASLFRYTRENFLPRQIFMAMSPKARHKARTFAMQLLYQWQIAGEVPHVLQSHFMRSNAHHKVDWDFFQAITTAVFTHMEEFNDLIQQATAHSQNPIMPIERALLWLGIAELKFELGVPHKVVLNEYVSIAEEYAAQDGYKFVNGVLNHLQKKIRIGV
jgi:transcription antitermination protein NusB